MTGPLHTKVLVAALVAAALGGCEGPRVGAQSDGGAIDPGSLATVSRLQDDIFTPKCASVSCHAASANSLAPMSLEPGESYRNLVGVPSTQVPSLRRVEPGDPARSYLMLKLRGAASGVGGAPSRMPLGKPSLTEEELQNLESWIHRGAPND